ncbi:MULTISPECIES: hypothetical protein [unclassified Streptomyces]|uniref:hypothetical protein n=1 Tax=unclassified Streptomyces TaxID=2593676 RepID=UPI000C08B186|nr:MULTISPECIES: hypothetical protein [unclassified Streptomyces]MYT96983.1 hypothetical protein [Streptomyces sp. SID8350]
MGARTHPFDDHGPLRAAHHDGRRLRGEGLRPAVTVPGVRGVDQDEVDGGAGPRPYQGVPQVDDDLVVIAGPLALLA